MKIEKLHDKLFEHLLYFDKLCKENDIKYFLDSGSAIGAVREHDFIPWDDDVDVAIMREDYIKLRTILKKDLPPYYKLIEPNDYEPYFFDMIPKFIDLRVPLRKETDEDIVYNNYQNCMSIDFIILDSVPDSAIIQKFIILKTKLIYGMLRSKRYITDSSNMNLLEKIAAGILCVPGKLFKLDTLLKMYMRNTMKYSKRQSSSLIRSNSILYFVDCYSKADYDSIVNVDFHGWKAPLPIGYDRILTKMYGDYMTPSKNYKGYVTHSDCD